MTPREAFHAAMRPGRAVRVPLLEDTIQDGVLDRWRAEGLGPDETPATRFGLLRREDIPVDWAPRPKLKSPLLSERGLEELARGLDPETDDRLPKDWEARCARWKKRDHVLALSVHDGILLSMGIGNWTTFEEVMDVLAADPVFARELMRIRGEFLAGYAARILRGIVPDYAVFSEPIAGNNGPVISPRMYRDLALASYRPLLEVLRRGGVETIVLMTWGNVRILLRDALDAGFTALWACEADPGSMDYRDLRREFGPRLGLLGGLDLDALLAGEEAFEAEVGDKAPPLLSGGGYVPLVDGRIRAGISFARYSFYRQAVARAATAGTT